MVSDAPRRGTKAHTSRSIVASPSKGTYVCVFIKLRVTAQLGPEIILIFLFVHSIIDTKICTIVACMSHYMRVLTDKSCELFLDRLQQQQLLLTNQSNPDKPLTHIDQYLTMSYYFCLLKFLTNLGGFQTPYSFICLRTKPR